MSQTIAFSTRSMNWTTRYSFTPDEYGVTDSEMVSFPYGKQNIAYAHDKTIDCNNFYGGQYSSRIDVITNENPSATKIYEAFSLEGTSGDWSTEFSTFTGDMQRSSFESGALVEKEGKFYSDIPKNSLNKDVTIKYVGETTIGYLKEAQDTQNIKLTNRVGSVPNQYLLFKLPFFTSADKFFELAQANGFGAESWIDYLELRDAVGGDVYFYDHVSLNPLAAILKPVEVFAPTEWNTYAPSANPPTVGGLNPRHNASTNSIDVQLFEFDYTIGAFYGLESDMNLDFLPVSIYTTALSTEANGEDMRGEYMKVSLSRQDSTYFELYAINVDQHNTKLDHSLGQNN